MWCATIEAFLYLSGAAFASSLLIYSLKIPPWGWHLLSGVLVIAPLIAISVLKYEPKEQDFLSSLREAPEGDEKKELVSSLLKWWGLRLIPVTIGVELVFLRIL